MKKDLEFKKGVEARNNFEKTMQKLFRAPKPAKKATSTAKEPAKENGK
jgi:hypothetical protein